MAFSTREIIDLYRKRAGHYDLTANLYYLVGFREQAYRSRAARALDLHSGDTVVELGCGTGLNFSLLSREVGSHGRILGVDLTDAMLDRARQRALRNGLANVELVQEDFALYRFPPEVDGIISTFALTLSPEFDTVIKNGCTALKPGGRFVVLDFKIPGNLLSLLTPLAVFLTRPFGVTRDLEERRPWESMRRYLKNVSLEEFYGGFAYIAVGEKESPVVT